jgi:uncharacterized membrane protein
MSSSTPSVPHADPGVFRLEAFSDAVFAFAATLLVVALEVPDTFAELEKVLLGFVPFTLSFFTLVMLWTVHRSFFRRFPIADRITVAINSCLLFVVLFYVYPLKFLTRAIASMFFGRSVSGDIQISTLGDLAKLFTWYGAGFAAIFFFVALLYRHGARRATSLGLGERERREAEFYSRHYAIFVLVSGVSLALALGGVGLRSAMPGWIYGFLGPLCGLHGWWNGRREARARG